jgi:4-hydroxy-3-polyprenylbenzoate decarboxylase
LYYGGIFLAKIILGLTGASGSIYAARLIEVLSPLSELHIICSDSGSLVFKEETGQEFTDFIAAHRLQHHKIDDFFSPLASGSNDFSAFIVCPCSMKSLAAIRHGLADNLILRVADVALKERRKLIIVPRETPLSTIHLENMLNISQMGGIILPAAPGFYHKPLQVQELVDFVVERICRLSGINANLLPGWRSG